MKETAERKITGNFDWQPASIVPAFVQGEDAKDIYDSIKDLNLGWCDYDPKTKTLRGDNPFIEARIDSLVRPLGLRVANLGDLGRPEIMRIVKGKYYSGTPALVLRSMKDSNTINLPLVKRVAELAEEKAGKLKFPFMVKGFDSPESYSVVPRDDFTVIYDERLDGKYDGKKFSDVDELGLPVFDKGGNRTWYARGEGLSGVYLDSDLGLYSRNDYLAYSDDYGRVVLVSEANQKFSAEGAARENLSMRLNELKVERDRQVEEAIAVVEKKYGKAMKLMKG